MQVATNLTNKLIISCFLLATASIAFYSFGLPSNKNTDIKKEVVTLSNTKSNYSINTFSEDNKNREILVADVPENKDWWKETYRELEENRKNNKLSDSFQVINKDYDSFIDTFHTTLNHVCVKAQKSNKLAIKKDPKYREDIGKYCTVNKNKNSIFLPYSISESESFKKALSSSTYEDRYRDSLVSLDEENNWWWEEQDSKFFGDEDNEGTGMKAKYTTLGFETLYSKKRTWLKYKDQLHIKKQCSIVYQQDITNEDFRVTNEVFKYCSYVGHKIQ